jgi:glycosyltransferase involved in cell wall biosynthesis
MKILIDARLYGLENAGLGRYVMNLIDRLSERDKTDSYTILLRKKYFNQLNLPGNWKKVLADYRHYTVIEQMRLPLIILKEKPDLIHFPHFNVPVFCPKPYVVTVHDLLMHRQKGKEATTLNPFIYSFKRYFYRYVFDNAVRKARKIIVPSETVKKEVVSFYKISKEKIAVTYEGVEQINEENFSCGVTNKYNIKKPYFIYAGNAYPHKNLDRVIEAVKMLNKKSGEKVNFVFVTSRNIFGKRLEAKIKLMKAGNYIKVLGYIPDADLFSLYRLSEAFVFPSLSEGFGLPGLEAMCSGTICLASNIDIFKEIYKDKVIYFEPLKTDSIAKAMEKALTMKPEVRNEMIKNGKEFVKVYSWDKMAQQTLKVYEDSNRL